MPDDKARDELTLSEIEGQDWGDPSSGETGLISNVMRWRRTPLCELGTEGLRELIGQQVSLEYLVPRAIAVLEQNPRAGGDLYPGDVLSSVLNVNRSYWSTHPDQWFRVERIVASLDDAGMDVDLTADIAAFRSAGDRPAPR